LLRLVRPPGHIEGGRILLNGQDLLRLGDAEMREARGRRISLVPQNAMNSLNPARTVLSQVSEATELTMQRPAAVARAAELLEMVGLAATHHRSYPHQLSGGMRQRVALAMALANSPDLLVADEPVTGLDVIVQAHVLRLLLELRATLRLSMLVVTHDLTAVSQLADEVLVMYAGDIVERGPVEQVLARPRHAYTRLLLRARPTVDGVRQPALQSSDEVSDATGMLERR
jgi:ABC-type glutathione transport system ATPase component